MGMNEIFKCQLREHYALWNSINTLYSRWAKERGMTYDSLFVLYAIYYGKGKVCQKEICEEWSMPKQTVNSILKNYEKKGYICFQQKESDKRNKTIRVTEKGQQFADKVIRELERTELSVLQKIGEKDMETLLGINRLLCQYFQEEMERESCIL